MMSSKKFGWFGRSAIILYMKTAQYTNINIKALMIMKEISNICDNKKNHTKLTENMNRKKIKNSCYNNVAMSD